LPAAIYLSGEDLQCFAEAEWLTVTDAFRLTPASKFWIRCRLRAPEIATCWPPAAKRAGFQIGDHDGWSDIFSRILAARG